MKRSNRITAIVGVLILVSVTLVGAFSVSATGGDQADPLITLSYLTQVVKPELLGKVDEQVKANEQALLGKVDTAIADYTKKMEEALGGTNGEGAVYTVIQLSKGELLYPVTGGEILLRSGSASVLSASIPAPVLHDATSGAAMGIGGALQLNHLYVIPVEGTVIAATTDCTLLVRGEYVVV